MGMCAPSSVVLASCGFISSPKHEIAAIREELEMEFGAILSKERIDCMLEQHIEARYNSTAPMDIAEEKTVKVPTRPVTVTKKCCEETSEATTSCETELEVKSAIDECVVFEAAAEFVNTYSVDGGSDSEDNDFAPTKNL